MLCVGPTVVIRDPKTLSDQHWSFEKLTKTQFKKLFDISDDEYKKLSRLVKYYYETNALNEECLNCLFSSKVCAAINGVLYESSVF